MPDTTRTKIVQAICKVWKRTSFLRSGFGASVVVLSLIALRLAWIYATRPAHFKEIIAAYGGDSLFHGEPQMAHDGKRFTLVKTSAKGYALFLCDADGDTVQIICEESGVNRQHDTPDIRAWPWSSDDSSFLYTIDDKLVLYELDTKQPSAQFKVGMNSVLDVVWLGPTKFAYVTSARNICFVQRKEGGGWDNRKVLTTKKQISSLTALGGDTVAWWEGDSICRVNLTEGVPGANAPAVKPPAPIAPTNGLVLWLDASTLKQSDQLPVMRLPDLGPRRNTAFFNNRPPTLNAAESAGGLRGKGTIHFAPLDSATNGTGLATHASPGITGSAPRSLFVVMRHDTNQSMMVNLGDTRAKGSLFAIEFNTFLYLPSGWRGADNRIKMASTNWNLLETIHDGTEQKGYVNGTLRGVTRRALHTADKPVEIGFRTSTNGKDAKAAGGDFAEMLIYDRALSMEERQQVEDYLGQKWFGKRMSQGLSPENPLVWLQPNVEGVTGFSYSRETGQFLLEATEGKQAALWHWDPNAGDPTKIKEGVGFQSAQWIARDQYACIRRDRQHRGIVLANADTKEEKSLFARSDLRWFGLMPGGQRLLMLGSINNEPSAGVWLYDLPSAKLRNLVPYSDEPSDYAQAIIPTEKTIKTPSGDLNCSIFSPPHVSRFRKYPLVIGDTRFNVTVNGVHGRQWVPCVAAGGAYVVIVERKGWRVGIERWSDNVMAAYNQFSKELPVDTSQVFLFGSSAETAYMDQVLSKSPGLWKGIILLNPAGMPEFSDAPSFQQRPRILVSAGEEEHTEGGLKQYQQTALHSGGLVEYIIHPGEGHHIVGNAAQLSRTAAIMSFIFEK